MTVYISNDPRRSLSSLWAFSERIRSHVRNKRAAVARKKCPWMKNRQLPLLYIQSTRYSQIVELREDSDSWERESSGLGSRERCYQRDEGTRRSLRIIESYDCLFRASAIRGCSSRWAQRSFVLRINWSRLPSANRQDDDITTGSQSFPRAHH